jgi:DNA mismatch repair protein MutL
VAALVTHYALAHPTKHFELHSATQALLTAPAVANAGERLYQIFGRETFESLIPVAAEIGLCARGIAGASAVEARRGL